MVAKLLSFPLVFGVPVLTVVISEPHCPLREAPHARATFTGNGQPIHPATHMQFVLPAVEIEFEGHGKQADGPIADLKVFAGHAVHGPPLGPVKPVLHIQSVVLRLPGTDTVNAGHTSQAAGPTTPLNVFAGHIKQGAPSAPVYPALHVHAVAPDSLCEFARHARQTPAAAVVFSDSILNSDNEASAKL